MSEEALLELVTCNIQHPDINKRNCVPGANHEAGAVVYLSSRGRSLRLSFCVFDSRGILKTEPSHLTKSRPQMSAAYTITSLVFIQRLSQVKMGCNSFMLCESLLREDLHEDTYSKSPTSVPWPKDLYLPAYLNR